MTAGRHTRDELTSQPECWSQASGFAGNRDLPQPGERVLMLGCGTSYYIGAAYAALREADEAGPTDAAVASDWRWRPALRQYDRVVAISRSGTSVELLEALDQLPHAQPVTGVLGSLDAGVATRPGIAVVDLQFADEQSVVQTRFATTALSALRAGLGHDLTGLVAEAREALSAPLPQAPGAQLVVLGEGWAAALAQEAALKCRESAAVWAEAYPTGEYRHGPLGVAGPQTLVWGLTPLGHAVTSACRETGAVVEQPLYSPQSELVRIQRFALDWALSKGRDPDRPPYLSRSVTSA